MKRLIFLFVLFAFAGKAQQGIFNNTYTPIDSIGSYESTALFCINDTFYSISAFSDTFPYGVALLFNKFDKYGDTIGTKVLHKPHANYYLNNSRQACLSKDKKSILFFTTYLDTTYQYHLGDTADTHDNFYEVDAILIAFNLNGDTIFTRKYDYTIFDVGQLVIPYGDGYALAAQSNTDSLEGNTNDHVRIIVTDSLFNPIWSQIYINGNISQPYSMGTTIDNGLCIGQFYRPAYVAETERNRYFKVDSVGNLVWSKGITAISSEYCPEVSIAGNGDIVMASLRCIDQEEAISYPEVYYYRLMLQKIYNQTGLQKWVKLIGDTIDNYGGSLLLSVKDVKVLSNEDIAVVGTTGSPNYKPNYIIYGGGTDTVAMLKSRRNVGYFLKTDSVGNTKFMRYYATVDTSNYYGFTSIDTTSDGGFILYGYVQNFIDYTDTSSTLNVYGKLWLVKTDANGCVDLSCINDIKEVGEEDYKLFIYPNPAQNLLNIDLPINCNSARVNFYNLSGQQVANRNIYSSKYQSINITDIPAGIFIVEVVAGSKLIGRNKLVVVK